MAQSKKNVTVNVTQVAARAIKTQRPGVRVGTSVVMRGTGVQQQRVVHGTVSAQDVKSVEVAVNTGTIKVTLPPELLDK